MSDTDAFDLLERQLRTAVRSAGGSTLAKRRFTRRGGLAAVAAALVVAGGALAATGTLPIGPPVDNDPAYHPTPHTGAGVVASKPDLLPLRVADPAGGPPWAVRVFRSTRGGHCLQVGQVVDGRLGIVTDDHNGRPQLRPLRLVPGAGSSLCSFQSRNGYPIVRGLRRLQLFGGLGDPRRCGASPCPVSRALILRYGMLGPQARSASFVDGNGQVLRRMRLDGSHGGAYLFVIAVDPAPYARWDTYQQQLGGMTPAERRHARPPAETRAAFRVKDGVTATFADGRTLRVAGPGRTHQPLPGVGRRVGAPATSVRAPLTVSRSGPLPTAVYTFRFHAPVAITRSDRHYVLTLDGPAGRRCTKRAPGGGYATTRDIVQGERVSFTLRPSFAASGSRWCPGPYTARVGYSTGASRFAGRLVGTYRFTVPR